MTAKPAGLSFIHTWQKMIPEKVLPHDSNTCPGGPKGHRSETHPCTEAVSISSQGRKMEWVSTLAQHMTTTSLYFAQRTITHQITRGVSLLHSRYTFLQCDCLGSVAQGQQESLTLTSALFSSPIFLPGLHLSTYQRR